MKYKERLFKEAQHQAAKVDEWLLPAEAGELVAEGMERTYRFKQDDIVDAVEEGAARKAIDLRVSSTVQLHPVAAGGDKSRVLLWNTVYLFADGRARSL